MIRTVWPRRAIMLIVADVLPTLEPRFRISPGLLIATILSAMAYI